MRAPGLNELIAGRSDRSAVRDAIGRAAEKTGADFNYLLAQAKSESGLNPNAKAGTSSATGLYQFIDQSWLGVLKQHGQEHGYGWAADAIRWNGRGWSVDPAMKSQVFALRRDPEASATMAGAFAQDNAEGLSRTLGREANSADLYFAHFLGLSGAKRFLSAADARPNAAAASLFPREAAANRSIFYTRGGEARSLSQVYALMAKKIGGANALERTDGIGGGEVQMASLSPTSTPLSKEPPSEVQLVDLAPSAVAPDALSGASATMTALNDRARMDMLRPSPQHAMLAYMMVLTPFDGSDRGA